MIVSLLNNFFEGNLFFHTEKGISFVIFGDPNKILKEIPMIFSIVRSLKINQE